MMELQDRTRSCNEYTGLEKVQVPQQRIAFCSLGPRVEAVQMPISSSKTPMRRSATILILTTDQ